MRSPGQPVGFVTAMGMQESMSAHLAEIEKVSNGFIVRFQKAQKIAVKRQGLESFGLDAETMEVVRAGIEKIKQGDEWKVPSDLDGPVSTKAPPERWITVSMAVACQTEAELLSAIRQAVAAHAEINTLMLAGEFSHP